MLETFSDAFSGFSPSTLEFLRNLKANNNRSWFAEHRSEYRKHLADPLKSLTASLLPMILELDPEIVPSPSRHIARINRDIRFSKDKSPYWTNPWLAFRRPLENWYRAPTWFFELHESGYSYGMNVYSPYAATMRRFREKIDGDPERFLTTTEFLRKSRTFKLKTEKYKREFPCPHPKSVEPWYRSKDIEVVCLRKVDRLLFSPKLVDTLLDGFVRMKPLYDYLWSVTVLG